MLPYLRAYMVDCCPAGIAVPGIPARSALLVFGFPRGKLSARLAAMTDEGLADDFLFPVRLLV
jgi:hypothetical protein